MGLITKEQSSSLFKLVCEQYIQIEKLERKVSMLNENHKKLRAGCSNEGKIIYVRLNKLEDAVDRLSSLLRNNVERQNTWNSKLLGMVSFIEDED